MDLWIDDTKVNREKLRVAFKECGMGDYYMLPTMQIVPGWTNFHLNNGLQLDLLVGMIGLEGFTFDECLQLASIADIDDVKVPYKSSTSEQAGCQLLKGSGRCC